MNMNNIIMEIDSQIAIDFLEGRIVAPKQIYNQVDDINFIVRILKTSLFLLQFSQFSS